MTALGIDLGTSGVRAAILDEAGGMAAFARAAIAPPDKGSPAAWWRAIQAALRELPLGGVRGLAVAGTSGTLLALDAAGEPVGPASLYNEQAEESAASAVLRAIPEGSTPMGATSPLARMPALLRRPGAVRIAHQADWIAGCFTGQFGISDKNNALKSGYDPIARRWPDWIAQTGVPVDALPRVLPPGTPIGPVRPELVRTLGFSSPPVVHAGTTDGCAAVLASGACRPGEAVTSLGSTLTLKVIASQPVASPAFGIYSHRLGPHWLAGGASNAGGAVLAHFFSPEALARLSARIDPQRDSGLGYVPLLRSGERFPVADPGLQPLLSPRPADDALFLHGMLEALARIEARGYQTLAECGAQARSVRSLGGGAANPAWTALRARLLGLPLIPATFTEAAFGAARLAGHEVWVA